MGMTMAQKILAAHAGLDYVAEGQLIEAELDLALANDITAPVAIREMEKAGGHVKDKGKVALVMDHFTPNKDIKAACQVKCTREFAQREQVEHFFDVGQMGIEHALLPERGLVGAGDCVIGADSHTCTYGALGAFSTGVGSTDLAAGMMTSRCWFKVPAAIRVELTGALPPFVTGKDVILHLIGTIGVDGALYKSLEFTGEGVKSLTMDDRFTICNMAIECGAKNGVFPVDEKTDEYPLENCGKTFDRVAAADDDAYERVIDIDLSAIRPVVAKPHLPSNTAFVDEVKEEIKIDQVVIGSWTNGRLSDLKQAAEVLEGKHVSPDVRTNVIPATNKIYLQALKAGYIETFIKGGAIVSTPTCGPCLGGHMGILASGEVAVTTTNRNFIGRMGAKDSYIYLASPATAMASAIAGKLASAGVTED